MKIIAALPGRMNANRITDHMIMYQFLHGLCQKGNIFIIAILFSLQPEKNNKV